MEYGCGKCDPCRYNRGRRWVGRIILESACHAHMVFLTLTHNEDSLRDLSKAVFQAFLKRLRASIHPRKIRYFASGEYGRRTERPHYHAIIFGVGLYEAETIKAAWSENGKSLGFVSIGNVSPRSIHYVALDLLKDVGKVKGFTLKSQGLGKYALPYVKRALESDYRSKLLFQGVFRDSGNIYGFGPYLKKKLLIEGLGMSKEDLVNYQDAFAMKVQAGRNEDFNNIPWWIKRHQILEVQRGKLRLMKERRLKI